jgi:peptidoglycan LD-endopeptidase CwlK
MSDDDIIVDSNFSFEEAICGTKGPLEIIDRLVLIDVLYYSFDQTRHHGQIVADRDLEDDIYEIFSLIEKLKFPLGKVIPIVRYNWQDQASMAANNCSGFNFRFIEGTTNLSLHARGRAVDINPVQNPIIYEDGKIAPPGKTYNPSKPGALTADHPVVMEFIKRGWQWGGNFDKIKDYHHFQKS